MKNELIICFIVNYTDTVAILAQVRKMSSHFICRVGAPPEEVEKWKKKAAHENECIDSLQWLLLTLPRILSRRDPGIRALIEFPITLAEVKTCKWWNHDIPVIPLDNERNLLRYHGINAVNISIPPHPQDRFPPYDGDDDDDIIIDVSIVFVKANGELVYFDKSGVATTEAHFMIQNVVELADFLVSVFNLVLPDSNASIRQAKEDQNDVFGGIDLSDAGIRQTKEDQDVVFDASAEPPHDMENQSPQRPQRLFVLVPFLSFLMWVVLRARTNCLNQ